MPPQPARLRLRHREPDPARSPRGPGYRRRLAASNQLWLRATAKLVEESGYFTTARVGAFTGAAKNAIKLLLLLTGGAKSAWRHSFAGCGERVGGAAAGRAGRGGGRGG